MTQRLFALFIFAVVPLLSTAAARGDAGKSPRPTVVALTAPPEGRTSFRVAGAFRESAASGVGFRVAFDGKKEVCCVFDAADGTPLYLSDGRQALVYDLLNFRVVRAESSFAYVKVDWEAGHERPLVFGVGAALVIDATHRSRVGPTFRLDRIVTASGEALKVVERNGDVIVFAAERPKVAVEAIQQSATDPTWFRFFSALHDQAFYRLDLTAQHIGQPVPAGEMRGFPDLAKLRQEMNLIELDAQQVAEFIAGEKKGPAWAVKLALAAGGSMREAAEKAVPGLDWGQMRRRDEVLGKMYRDALAKQGISFSVAKGDAATTVQPPAAAQ